MKSWHGLHAPEACPTLPTEGANAASLTGALCLVANKARTSEALLWNSSMEWLPRLLSPMLPPLPELVLLLRLLMPSAPSELHKLLPRSSRLRCGVLAFAAGAATPVLLKMLLQLLLPRLLSSLPPELLCANLGLGATSWMLRNTPSELLLPLPPSPRLRCAVLDVGAARPVLRNMFLELLLPVLPSSLPSRLRCAALVHVAAHALLSKELLLPLPPSPCVVLVLDAAAARLAAGGASASESSESTRSAQRGFGTLAPTSGTPAPLGCTALAILG
mmetsp:Transcript_58116/g.168433  ORF Transcript_58116/g.168433 Transcript_58116/m.168433 type:complete len:275 (+) Transcript_58116:431-1255(+)